MADAGCLLLFLQAQLGVFHQGGGSRVIAVQAYHHHGLLNRAGKAAFGETGLCFSEFSSMVSLILALA